MFSWRSCSSAAQPASDELSRPICTACPGCGAAQPASDGCFARPARLFSGAAQPALDATSTALQLGTPCASAETLLDIQECICAADARDYHYWRRKNPQEPRKSVSNLVGHIQSAFRQRFESSADQPALIAEPRVPFDILLGWLGDKIASHGADMEDGKELLWELARDEHRLYRMKALAAQANSCDDAILSPEHRMDKAALNEVLPLVEQAAEASKKALREFAGLPPAPQHPEALKRAVRDPACNNASQPACEMHHGKTSRRSAWIH